MDDPHGTTYPMTLCPPSSLPVPVSHRLHANKRTHTISQGIALGHIMKGRSEEWWKVKLHGTALFGFFAGGFAGFFAFEVRFWLRLGLAADE
jgi:hypothetical protein